MMDYIKTPFINSLREPKLYMVFHDRFEYLVTAKDEKEAINRIKQNDPDGVFVMQNNLTRVEGFKVQQIDN